MTAVLFTCAGQRVDIVTAFKRAGATTIAADLDPLAPALYHADRHAVVPRVTDPLYLPALAELVEENDVRLIVPLNDVELTLLARARGELGALVPLPEAEIVEAMSDKYVASVLLGERGIASPPSWLPEELPAELDYPVLVKARAGFGSRHIYRANDRAELDFHLARTPVASMVQRFCAGEEFSVDVLSDMDGRCLNAIPRTMIQSKGGESIKGMTIKDWELIDFGRTVAEALPLCGPANIQVFRGGDGRIEVTDVNPRFGGAFPLPLAAGSRYPELTLELAEGGRPEPRVGDFREGVVMTRYFSHLLLVDGPDGVLEPFAEELPAAVAGEPGEE
jgi:carbamoyl-phosphate synthase large subunit